MQNLEKGLQTVVTNLINDINENGEVTHPEGETTTPIIRELINYKGKINNTVDELINEFLEIQLFYRNGGVKVLSGVLTNIENVG